MPRKGFKSQVKCQAYLAVYVVFPVHFPPALFNETIDMGSDQISSGYHYSYPFRSFSFAETDIFKHTQAISKHIPKTIQLAKLVIQHVIYIFKISLSIKLLEIQI